jgi:bla regulator protein blaR1
MSADFFSRLLAHLVEPAARASALAILVGVGLALLRARAAALKFTVWRAVLAAALAMPLLAWLAPGLPVILPRPAWADAALAKLPETIGTGRDLPKSSPERTAEPNLQRITRLGQPAIPRKNASKGSEGAPRMLTSSPSQPNALAQTNPMRPFPWALLAMLVYFLGAAALLTRLVVGWVFSRKLARSAEKLTDPRLVELFAEQAAALKLRRPARLAVSNSVAVPVTLGTLSPIIVLPASSMAWDERKCRAVFAHELSHVARRDALTFLFSSLHRSLFWFSPLAWWLDRKLAALAEQASDDWALGRVQDRIYYAELLLEFWKDLDGAPMRVRWEGVSMARKIRMNDRLERILNAPAWSKGLRKPAGVVLLLAAAPVLYFAAAVEPTLAPQAPALPAPAVAPAPALAPVRPVAPSPATAPAKPARGVFGVGQMPPPGTAPVAPGPPALAAAPSPAVAPVPPALAQGDQTIRVDSQVQARRLLSKQVPDYPPLAKLAGIQGVVKLHALIAKDGTVQQLKVISGHPVLVQAATNAVSKWKYRPTLVNETPVQVATEINVNFPPTLAQEYDNGEYDTGEEYRTSAGHYVIVSDHSHTMSGDMEDLADARSYRHKIQGDYIWFRRNHKEYIIRDKATVEQAKALFAPQEVLGKKQEALGKVQEQLGAQQEEMGKKMEEVRVKLPDLREELKKIEAELADLDTPRTQEELGQIEAELGELQSRIAEAQSRAGHMQGQFGAQQGELGRKQGELGRAQGELGREQGRLAREANRKMKALLDDALAHKTAEPAPE